MTQKKLGYRIATVPVLGKIGDLTTVIEERDVDEVLIALPSTDGQTVRSIVEHIERAQAGLKYRIMPGVYELLSGEVDISRIREVEIEDLLRRPPIELDTDAISSYITGKTVMVTGAGGSIGSELVRQICRFNPKELILFGHGENSIYKLERELDRTWPSIPYHSVIAAVQNVVRLDYIFQHYQPASCLSHRGPQTRSPDGTQPRRGYFQQRDRQQKPRHPSAQIQRLALRQYLNRQGRQPHLDHGGLQADG